MFIVKTNSILDLRNSYFAENYSLSRGSIILADFKNVNVFATNVTFHRNQAYFGGVFFAHFSSNLVFENCTFTENFAIQGGIGNL